VFLLPDADVLEQVDLGMLALCSYTERRIVTEGTTCNSIFGRAGFNYRPGDELTGISGGVFYPTRTLIIQYIRPRPLPCTPFSILLAR
jgi:hypothetical protein